MATYFVANGGSGSAPTTWSGAYGTLAAALAAATTNGDIVVIQYNSVPSADAELSADTTFTISANISIISASNDGGSAYTPTPMGTANWIGNSTTNRAIIIAGSDTTTYIYGITLRTSGSTTDNISLTNSQGQTAIYDNCYIWCGNTNTGAVINLGGSSATVLRCINTTFRFGNTSQNIVPTNGNAYFIGCSISTSGSSPGILIDSTSTSGASLEFNGCDLSFVTGALVGDIPAAVDIVFDRCKLGNGVTVLSSQVSNPTLASPQVWISDSAFGDVHMVMGYYNALGSVVSDTGIYFTSNNTDNTSWKITTTSLATNKQPFYTPYIDLYYTGTSAITPYLEVLRDGSTTAYKDSEIWAEFSGKTTSGQPQSTMYSDISSVYNYVTNGGSNQATGAGAGNWTGESGTIWSGKLDSGSSFTPAEVGNIRVRIGVTVNTSSTPLYVHPEILF